MWSTLFIVNVQGAVTMVTAAGISWALTLWAPFALIAQCVSHINDISRQTSIASSRITTPDLRPCDQSPYISSGISISNPDERITTPQMVIPTPNLPKEKKDEITSAGTILGLHNVFISSPQFVSTLLASLMFHFLGAGGRGDDIHPQMMDGLAEGRGGGSIAWVLRIGGLGGIYAAYLTWRLAEKEDAFPPGVEY
jgi:solute carrier family 45 protein 1/2/4